MPPPETAVQGVYCTGDDCHKIRAKWERPKEELLPPKTSVDPVWVVEGFGRGGSTSGATAPIHFGDVPSTPKEPAVSPNTPVKPASKPPRKAAAKTPLPKKAVKKGGR
jgi:hypothetical protein